MERPPLRLRRLRRSADSAAGGPGESRRRPPLAVAPAVSWPLAPRRRASFKIISPRVGRFLDRVYTIARSRLPVWCLRGIFSSDGGPGGRRGGRGGAGPAPAAGVASVPVAGGTILGEHFSVFLQKWRAKVEVRFLRCCVDPKFTPTPGTPPRCRWTLMRRQRLTAATMRPPRTWRATMAASPALLPAGPLPTPLRPAWDSGPGTRAWEPQWERRGGGNPVTDSKFTGFRKTPAKFGSDFYSAHASLACAGPLPQLEPPPLFSFTPSARRNFSPFFCFSNGP